MPVIPYEALLKVRSPDCEFAWSDRDAMLYALGIGMGRDPLDQNELAFVYEKDLKVVPSFATVAAWGSNPPLAATGVDYSQVVHAEQAIRLHRPLPASARVRADGGIIAAIDKGDKGAILMAETTLKDAESGEPYVTLSVAWFARADGHFGGPATGGTAPHLVPDRPPDKSVDYATRTDQALLYRLVGDRNPLHADPEVARRAGFERPILHGLCTFGICCRAVLQHYAAFDPDRMVSHKLRFSAPVYPGEVVTVDLWRDGGVVSFRARVKERNAIVIQNGCAELR